MYRVSYFLLALVLFSCKSDDETVVEQRSEGDIFYGLQVGNEWNYDYFKVDANEELVNTGVKQHVEITSESLIDGENLYYTLTKTTTGNSIPSNCAICPDDGTEISRVRDSVGFLINLDGRILFSSQSTQEVVTGPLGHIGTINIQLVPGTPQITVPAGTFETLDNEIFGRDIVGERFPSTYNIYYSPGVGEIKETTGPVSTQNKLYEKQLVSYTVQ